MKKFSHDYTKAAAAESHLYAAQQLNAHDDPIEAWKHVQDAREVLQQYLAQDNMVEDDDVADGWVKESDFGLLTYYALYLDKTLVNIYGTKELAEKWKTYYTRKHVGKYEITPISPVFIEPND